MNKQWQHHLRDGLARLEAGDHLRTLRQVTPSTNTLHPNCDADADSSQGKFITRDGRSLLNFAGNDYLALSQHPVLKSAAIEAIKTFGVGSGASRLVTGHLSLHAELEARFASFKHAEAALLFSTGYMANLAVLTALPQANDIICMDKLSHASLIDAARASDATLRIFPHLNDDKLARTLERIRSAQTATPTHSQAGTQARAFIVTDSVFSMDGDIADLPRLCALADQFNAVLIVDEAHATGVLGDNGSGLCELQNVADQVDVVISTASKALGGLGGIVTGANVVIDTLINRARSLIYTTAPPPAQVAAMIGALDVIEAEPQRRRHVLALAKTLRDRLASIAQNTESGVLKTPATDLTTPIIPMITGSAESALGLSQHLEKQGICAPAIRPPTVAPNSARVRLTVRADMDESDVDRLIAAITSWLT